MEPNLQLIRGTGACTDCYLSEYRLSQRGEFHACSAWHGGEYREGGLMVMVDMPTYYDGIEGKALWPATTRTGTRRTGGLWLNVLAEEVGYDPNAILRSAMVRCKSESGSADKHPDAVAACGRWTRAETEHYRPGVIMLAGKRAMQEVFGATARSAERAGWVRMPGQGLFEGILCMATYSPVMLQRDASNAHIIRENLRLAVSLLPEWNRSNA